MNELNKPLQILSIDVDVFHRCVEYQDWQDEDLTPMQSWQVIKWKSQAKGYTDELFEPDFDTIEFVKKILDKKCKKAQPYIIQEHDEIYNILKSLPSKHNSVTNIDNHHDLGYGHDDEELTIANWVRYARRDNLLLSYFWICRDDSEVAQYASFNYMRSSWKDVNVDALPEYDVVVFCTSKHYTPPMYWNITQMLNDYLVEYVQNDMVECEEPEINLSDFPTFDGDDYDGEGDIVTKWWRHKGFYVTGDLVDGVMWLAMINVEGKKLNILPVLSKIVRKVIKEYKIVGFCWVEGYKSENLIRRLAKPYQTIDNYKDNGNEYLILKEE